MFKIDCKDIDYILAISKHGNISKAAEELFVSQPALTKYLRNLEERMGHPLFIHGKRPLVPTPVGEIYLSYAREIAILKSSLENELARAQSSDFGMLRVGFACTGLRRYILHAVTRMQQESGYAQISLVELNSGDIETKLLNNQLDIGFITLPSRSDQLETEPLKDEELLLAVPVTHPLADLGGPYNASTFPTIDLNRFRSDAFVLRNENTRFRTATNILFQQARFTPKVFATARNGYSCIEYAKAWGVCCITTRDFALSLKDPESMRFFVAGPQSQYLHLGAAYAKARPLSPTARQLLNLIHRDITNYSLY